MNILFKKRSKNRDKRNERNDHDLRNELLDLLSKKFDSHIQLKIGQLKQTHLLKRIRREIARIKYHLSNTDKRSV